MKIVIVLLTLLLVSGCVSDPSEDMDLSKLSVSCISGVQYYHYAEKHRGKGYGYMAPAYNRDGTLKLC